MWTYRIVLRRTVWFEYEYMVIMLGPDGTETGDASGGYRWFRRRAQRAASQLGDRLVKQYSKS